MSSFTIPHKRYDGIEERGDGLYQEFFDVYTVAKESSDIFPETITQVSANEKYLKDATDFAKGLPTITKSTCIKTADGVPILYFIKRGMISPLGELATTVIESTLVRIKKFLSIYPPPNSLGNNVRHNADLAAQIEKSKALGRPYGVFHWNFSYPVGQKTPVVSAEAQPQSKAKREALERFFHVTRSEHGEISKWLKALEPEDWQRYNDCYQKTRADGKLGVLDDGENGIQSGHAFLINAKANPHKDKGDVKRGWTITYQWGDFSGGEVVFLDLGLKFGQQQGDILMAPASVLTHMVLEHQGDRYSHVWYTKANVMGERNSPTSATSRTARTNTAQQEGSRRIGRTRTNLTTKLLGRGGPLAQRSLPITQ